MVALFRYSTLINGWSYSVNLDSAGNPYVVGFTFDWAFPVTQNAFQPGLKGFDDGFLFKIDMAAASPGIRYHSTCRNFELSA